MSGLSREILRWLQSLDLTWQIKNPKRNFTNGSLVAEIFSWYYPEEIQMHMYNNGTSLDSKLRNWSLLRLFIKKHDLNIPDEFIEGTIHCKEGAAQLLIEKLYEILTNRAVKKKPLEYEVDFTDHAYQAKLPMHARSTASKAIKNNLSITEILADRNIILNQQKAQTIINNHVEHRQIERLEDPERFNIKPTLGDLSQRKPPPPPQTLSQESTSLSQQRSFVKRSKEASTLSQEPTYQFREIEVKQVHKKTPSFQGVSVES
ncbi:spermatogenesis-associated protein 4-like [Lineus longissimus]|uniref:spermatogenesis-associated protein 4-like n=1 Tax=Lineus longissimus TaxID=88925 RepID=UPI002B4D299F